MTEPQAPPERSLGHPAEDPYEHDGWFGSEEGDQPSAAAHVPDGSPPPRVDRPPAPPVNTWTVNGQLRSTGNSALTFKPPVPPWYRTRHGITALIAAACVLGTAPVLLLALRGQPAAGPGESTSIAPRATTSAQPAPTSSAPAPIEAPPPPLPPSPPTSAEEKNSAPAYVNPDPWTPSAPSPIGKPEIGVTRTPATRAPISVAPQPQQPTVHNSATPGDGRRRHWGPW